MRGILILLFTIWSFAVWSQSNSTTLFLDNNLFESKELNAFMSLYTDVSGALTIEDILSEQRDFQPNFSQNQKTLYPAAHWLKINIKAEENITSHWLIFKSDNNVSKYLTFLSYVDVFFVKNEKVAQHKKSGYYVPKKEKAIPERAAVNAIPFSMNKGDSISLFIRVGQVHKTYETQLRLELSRPIVNISNTQKKYAWVIFGSQVMYAMIGFYMLVFWLFVKNPSYLYFGIFCLLFSLHYLNLEPVSSYVDRFFPNNPHNMKWLKVINQGSSLFFLLFGRSFSEVKSRLPKWDKYLLLVIFFYLLIYFNNFLKVIAEPYVDNPLVSFIAVFILILPLAIKFILGKHIFAKIFGIGILFFQFWNCMGILWNFGLVSLPFNPWPIGQIGLLMIYAFGLGYKLLDSQKQKAKADRIHELDKIKSRFFANISHEFRTPLSLILGPINQSMENIPASESIGDNDEIPVKGKHLKIVKRNAIRLQNLVDQLLDLSKLDNGKMNLKVAEGNIIQFIRSIVFSFESLAERRHIHFHTSFPNQLKETYFDKDKLEKILVNLLSNAFKFTPEHGRVSVSVKAEKGQLKIQISDSGNGMYDEEIEKIFDRFYQVEGTEAKGSGIGLSLVKELVDLHNGQISVDSIKDKGTTFKISLPYQKADFDPGTITSISKEITPSQNAFMQEELVKSDNTAKEPGRKIPELPIALVVEDNPDLRQYITENIEQFYQVISAKNGKEGETIAFEKIPDIIISDVMMPKKSGFELCDELKKDSRTSHIPIILLTAKAGQEHKITGLEQGADEYLTKPFDVRELIVRMSNLINQRQRLREKFSGELKIGPSKIILPSIDERFLRDVMIKIEENIGNEFFTVEELASSIGFSRSQLHRKIKALTGKSSNQLIREFRLTRAKELLEQKSATVSEIAYEVGYSNLSYFTKSYKDAFGVLPSEV